MPDNLVRPLRWIGAAYRDFLKLPDEVRRGMGYALYFAQLGKMHEHAKPLKGFRGAGVLEVVEILEGDTYRSVYTVTFKDAVYVLHAFQKKSKTGIKMPQKDIELIKSRLAQVRKQHQEGTR